MLAFLFENQGDAVINKYLSSHPDCKLMEGLSPPTLVLFTSVSAPETE